MGMVLPDNKNHDRGRNMLLLVIHVEKSLTKTREGREQISSKCDIKLLEKCICPLNKRHVVLSLSKMLLTALLSNNILYK